MKKKGVLLKIICGFILLAIYSASAGTTDIKLINPEAQGQVILFYKDENSIIIRECVDYTILEEPNHRQDCIQKPESKRVQVPVAGFKYRLQEVLKLPLGENYTPLMTQKIQAYKNKKRAEALRKRQHELIAAIYQIQNFIEKYKGEEGEVNEDSLEEIRLLGSQLSSVEQKLKEDSYSLDYIGEVARRIEALASQIIDSDSLNPFVYSQYKTNFEFNFLKSYLKFPGISAKFTNVKAGTFQMGSPLDEEDRDKENEIPHLVTLTQDFQIQTTEMTQLQYFLVTGKNPSYFKKAKYCPEDYRVIDNISLCPNHPVEKVSWEDVQNFISLLNQSNTQYTYRLPTEAEWEHSSRGCKGADELMDMANCMITAFNLGDNVSTNQVNYNGNYPYKDKPQEVYRGQTVKVGSLPNVNNLGLYDTHGNVSEWMEDVYIKELPRDHVVDPQEHGKDIGFLNHIIRGGSWKSPAKHSRSAHRIWQNFRTNTTGFRLVRAKN